MAKRTRPSFSASKPATSKTGTTTPDTAWVYRTEDGTPESGEPAHTAHYEEAQAILRKYAIRGAFASSIPVPIVDMAALGAVHVRMVRAIAELYGVPFDQVRARAVVTAVAGGAVTRSMGKGLLKAVPGIGAVAAVAMPAWAGTATYALGKMVIKHFESGGGMDDLDPDAVRPAPATDGAAA